VTPLSYCVCRWRGQGWTLSMTSRSLSLPGLTPLRAPNRSPLELWA
jgi:hypothetical protein